MLQEGEISGYMILNEDTPKIIIMSNGINETIFKYVTEEITEVSQIMKIGTEDEIKKEMQSGNFNIDYEKIHKNILDKIENSEANIENISNSNLSYTMIEFYTLIAMTCLYGGTLGMAAINQNLANMSNNGKRVSVSKTPKGQIILSSIIASFVIQLIGLAILFAYTVFVLKVDYGTNFPLIILLGVIGAFAGLSMGLMVGTVIKASENAKSGILIAVTMLGCFLSRNDGDYNEIYY